MTSLRPRRDRSNQIASVCIANLYGYLLSRFQGTQHNLATTLDECGVTGNAFDVTLKLECQPLDRFLCCDCQTNLSTWLGRRNRPIQAIPGVPEARKANCIGCDDAWGQLVEEVFLGLELIVRFVRVDKYYIDRFVFGVGANYLQHICYPQVQSWSLFVLESKRELEDAAVLFEVQPYR